MKMEKIICDWLISRLIIEPQRNSFPRSNPSNHVYVPTVTFYEMPEPPPLSRPLPKADDTSDDTPEDD